MFVPLLYLLQLGLPDTVAKCTYRSKLSCHPYYSLWADLLHSLVTWLTLSPFSLHILTYWSNIIIIISLSNCFVAHCGSFCDEPTLITGLAGKQVVQIACGSSHSAAVTSEGELYTWGRGNYGRLGHGTVALLKQSNFCMVLKNGFG